MNRTRSRRLRVGDRVLVVLAVGIAAYVMVAYVAAPLVWRRYALRHPALDDLPDRTYTGSRIPGDPLNVALIGSETEVTRAMLSAGWFPADPLTLRSCLKIAADTVLRRSYDDAPVSNLFLWGRKEDLAFEKPVGDSPRQRHHVRFWQAKEVDEQGRPLWIGATSYDISVGLSHTTGQITHHIAPDLDAERDRLMDDLQAAGALADLEPINGFHAVRQGRNGGGDPWYTDGRLLVGVLKGEGKPLR